MNVLINGIGNIGTTLISVLNLYKNELGIDKIIALKNSPMPWHEDELEYLESQGVIICTRNNDDDYTKLDVVIQSVDYIFDCTNNGGGLKNKQWYKSLPNLKGVSAQGSEKNFGISFMSGINHDAIRNEKFVHIVSCNTHAIASLITSICGEELTNLESSDFVIARRSEDLGNHERLVSANVVARHLDDRVGTHHAIDVIDLFQTIGKNITVTSSDITTPSQLMHAVRFNITLKKALNADQITEIIANNPFLSTTTKFDSNKIFERGRRISPQGRIYSHAIIVENNLMFVGDKIIGWAFIPQEGNTILSTVNAFLLQTQNPKEAEIIKILTRELISESW